MDRVKGDEVKFVDMTIYHIPEPLARSFKEFCRLHANNRCGIGLELLVNSFKEKESYLFLTNEVYVLRQEVDKLKDSVASLQPVSSDVKSVKTFGGDIKL